MRSFLEGFRFLKYKKFPRSDFFFFEFAVHCVGFRFRKCKKGFPLRKYKNSFDISAGKFHFPKYKDFFFQV